MPSGHKSTIISFILAKFLFTIVVGLLFFFYNIENIGEDNTSILYNNLYKESSPNEDKKVENPDDIHDSAWIISGSDSGEYYNTLCQNNNKLCAVINNTVQDQTKRQTYNTLTLSLLLTIKKGLKREYNNLEDALSSITIKDEAEGKRGYANHHAIVLNIDKLSPNEYVEVLTHELGHIIDLGLIDGSSLTKDSHFTEFGNQAFGTDDISLLYYALSRDSEEKRKDQTKKDFCTVYGMTNPFEDFAECFNLYINHQDYFLNIKKSSKTLEEKYNFISKIIRSRSMLESKGIAYYNNSESYRYWDSTRIITR